MAEGTRVEAVKLIQKLAIQSWSDSLHIGLVHYSDVSAAFCLKLSLPLLSKTVKSVVHGADVGVQLLELFLVSSVDTAAFFEHFGVNELTVGSRSLNARNI